MAREYDIGDSVRLTATYRNHASTIADPSSVVFRVRNPSQVVATYTVQSNQATRTGVGAFHLDVTPDQAGGWDWSVLATGVVQAYDEMSFYVRPRQIP